jgi:isopenicillin N synthase-like dioxygenase
MSGLPVIDLSPLVQTDALARTAVASKIAQACHDIGFMVIRGHGIPATVITRLRQAVIDLFARPIEDKLALSITRDNYRGYIPLGFFTPNAAGKTPDRYEGYKLHFEAEPSDPIRSACSLYGPNKWPDQPAGLRATVLDYWRHCDRVADMLMGALAHAMGIQPDVFSAAFDKPLTNMTLLHYPPRDRRGDEFGIHPHKDTDALTILAPDPVGGLQVRPQGQHRWIAADAPDDALIVNIGDLLEIWSGGYFVSTPHRVINDTGKERYSFPYFAVPRFDVLVAPLQEPQPGFVHREIAVGDVSRDIWHSNWPNAAPIDARYDPATP